MKYIRCVNKNIPITPTRPTQSYYPIANWLAVNNLHVLECVSVDDSDKKSCNYSDNMRCIVWTIFTPEYIPSFPGSARLDGFTPLDILLDPIPLQLLPLLLMRRFCLVGIFLHFRGGGGGAARRDATRDRRVTLAHVWHCECKLAMLKPGCDFYLWTSSGVASLSVTYEPPM